MVSPSGHIVYALCPFSLHLKIYFEISSPSRNLSPMELESVLHFLQDKTFLVIGATGYLAKGISLSWSTFCGSMHWGMYLATYFDVFNCLVCSFCREDTQGPTKCEETLSSFESHRYWICHSSLAPWGELNVQIFQRPFVYFYGWVCLLKKSLFSSKKNTSDILNKFLKIIRISKKFVFLFLVEDEKNSFSKKKKICFHLYRIHIKF